MFRILVICLCLSFGVAVPAMAHGRLVSPSSSSNLCPPGQVSHKEGKGVNAARSCVPAGSKNLIKVHEGQVLSTIPAPGSLDAPAGMSVFVSSSSCPAGQIMHLVLGNVSQGIPRQTSCVAR